MTESARCPECQDYTFVHTVESYGRYMRETLVDPAEYPELIVHLLDGDERICTGCGYRLTDEEAESARDEAREDYMRAHDRPLTRPRYLR